MTASRREFEIAGFRILELSTANAAVSVVPALGARLHSLRNRQTGREWLSQRKQDPAFWANDYAASFQDSIGAGADECLPTIEPCQWNGRSLPDHGELWTEAWTVDEAAWQERRIVTECRARQSGFRLSRSVSLEGSSVHLDYALTNENATEEAFLWAFHPLFDIQPGDAIHLPDEVTELTVEAALGAPDVDRGTRWAWPQPFPGFDLREMRLGGEPSYVKAFTGPLPECRAGITNPLSGDSLEFEWDSAPNPFLGVWITRGGYNGQHQAALEPTNAPGDNLERLTPIHPHLLCAPSESRAWSLRLHLRGKG